MTNRIPEEVIEDVQKANDIVDVVGEYVQLKKQGRNYFGLCPFHEEKTPSFSVTQDKQIYHCFGCKKGGNVFNFLMEIENYSFAESLKVLAEQSGITLPKIASQQKSSLSQDSQNILEAYDWLAKLYHHLLSYTDDGKRGLDYFNDRGIDKESIDTFQLGFAPNIKNFTAEFLEKKGFHQQLLIKAGILNIQENQEVVDPFRGRIIFPIRNHLGKTIAFGGRSINDQEPKYLNSSESELFQKNRILFNFDLAKRHIRKTKEAILLEGQMDVISAYQAGVTNVVATLGTSLTEGHAQLLKRYVDTVIICYDPDQAGVEASFRAATLLRKVGCQVKVARLTNNMDPDAYIKESGGDAFKKDIIDTSDTYLSFYMRYTKRSYNLSIEGDRIEYIHDVLKEIAMVESSIEREHYLQELSNDYNLSMDTLIQEVEIERQKKSAPQHKSLHNRYTNKVSLPKQTKKLMPAYKNAERHLIAYMLQDRYVAEKVQDKLSAEFTIDDHKIIVTHLYAFYENGQEANVSRFIDQLSDDRIKQLVIEISILSTFESISENVLDDYISLIQRQGENAEKIKKIKEDQRLAEQQNDPIKAAQIAMEMLAIKRNNE